MRAGSFFNPLGKDDPEADADGDGLNNLDEVIRGTRPDLGDSDGDGVSDVDEVNQRSNPLNSAENAGVTVVDVVFLKLTVGDHSGSNSERYNLVVGGDDDGLQVVHQAPQFGVVTEDTYAFRRGQSYRIRIKHRGTNLQSGTPDYDYTAFITGVPGSTVPFSIDDPENILGVHDEGNPGKPFTAIDQTTGEDKEAILCIPASQGATSFKARVIIDAARSLAASNPGRYLYATDWDGPGGLSAPSYKCNLFVFDALQAAGIDVPRRIRGFFSSYLSPPVANEWATEAIPGFTRIDNGTPQPGDIIIKVGGYGGLAHGHMGIVTDGNCKTISVLPPTRGDKIVENEFGFRSDETYVIQRPN